MSKLSEALKFEKFHLGDVWKKIKKDPWRLAVGAGDPWGTKIWGKITGKDDMEPLLDQMGGAYGGHTISAFGNNEGGVYGRAEAAGVPTGAAKSVHDAAHVIAAFYGLGGGAGAFGGGTAAPVAGGSGPALGSFGGTTVGGVAGGGGTALGGGGAGLGTAGVMEGPVAGSAIGASDAGGGMLKSLESAFSGGQPGGQKQPEQPPEFYSRRRPERPAAVNGYVARYGDALRRLTALTTGAPQAVGGADVGA